MNQLKERGMKIVFLIAPVLPFWRWRLSVYSFLQMEYRPSVKSEWRTSF